MALTFVRPLVSAFVAVLPGMAELSAGEEPRGAATAESAQVKSVEAGSLVVRLQAGADSPRAAVSAFAAASNAGDAEAALLLIDPCVRPLLLTEVLLEEYLLEQHLLRNSVMTEEERKSPLNNLGAFPMVYAKRDLLRTVQIEVLQERPSTAGRDRMLLDVDWKVRAWDRSNEDDQFDFITVTLLAVRREGRWYLFDSFGAVNRALLYSNEFDYAAARRKEAEGRIGNADTVLRNERRVRPDGGPRSVVFNITYLVPIEVVHEELVIAAQSAEVAELAKQTQHLIRFKNGLQNQVSRGDFRDLAALDKVLDAEAHPVFESLVHRFYLSFEPAVNGLLRKLPKKPVTTGPARSLRRTSISHVPERPSVALPCNSRPRRPN